MNTLVELIIVWGVSAIVLLFPTALVVVWALNRSWSRHEQALASENLPAAEASDRVPHAALAKAA